MSDWAGRLNLDAVIWTALPPKFKGKSEIIIDEDGAVKYLRELPYEKHEKAKKYICNAPQQIDTLYRRRFEREFGWKMCKK